MNPIRILRAVVGLSQAQLAAAAGTSQPTIASYESGAKSPTWRTIVRAAERVGVACYPWVGPAMTRDQRRSLALHLAIAAELAARPESVLETARRNIAVMRAAVPGAGHLLDEWNRILRLPTGLVASRMLDPSDHGRDLRQVTPFAGILDARSRGAVYRAFRSAA
ncbi:MAG: helix-turn-helix domain-containing protein [Acidimicrobiia bacterium]